MQIEKDFEIKNYTSFKIGGKIKRICFPETYDEFCEILKTEKNAKVVGNLSNTLISSDGYDGVLISTNKLNTVQFVENKVIAAAGVKGPKLAQIAADKGLSGLEFMIGFPASLAGAVFMNASANGQCVSDCLKYVKIFDGQKVRTLTNDEMEFSYRKSVCQEKGYIVLEAEFELTKINPDIIKTKMSENLEFRKAHQPSLALPNCGSIFKNPENNSAGKLLDECGVKGLQKGGAKVWEGHANFIINTGNATSNDVLSLMCEMKNRVSEKFNIELLPEIKFLGTNNEEEVELCRYLKIK